MATARSHAYIARPADEVWALIGDPGRITDWFPGVAACAVDGTVRHVTTSTGVEVDEDIVTNDSGLRRFQYSLRPGVVPVDHHLNTIDVIEDGDGSLVIYSSDVAPDGLGPAMQQSVEGAVGGLKRYIES